MITKKWCLLGLIMSVLGVACSETGSTTTDSANPYKTIRIATFNVSMEADNYAVGKQPAPADALFKHLQSGEHQQIKNIAQIIQRVRPDIILLNEFDYQPAADSGPTAFIQNYLLHGQEGQKPIDYPYFYYAPVNTGVASGIDLDGNGKVALPGDAFAYGRYPGQYGMLLLSRFPIDEQNIRTFQHFLWKDMPGALIDKVKKQTGQDWYSSKAKSVFRLSSKSHWDIPIMVDDQRVHVLASHPTPPVFDGPEDRNGMRNHDEIRFWNDYLSEGSVAQYIYDDKGQRGGFNGQRFVILGDLNASQNEGDGMRTMMADLLQHPQVMPLALPTSEGGKVNRPDNPNAQYHTAAWGLAVDYVIASNNGFISQDAGIFWPIEGQSGHQLVESREASSDHRLVWRDLTLID